MGKSAPKWSKSGRQSATSTPSMGAKPALGATLAHVSASPHPGQIVLHRVAAYFAARPESGFAEMSGVDPTEIFGAPRNRKSSAKCRSLGARGHRGSRGRRCVNGGAALDYGPGCDWRWPPDLVLRGLGGFPHIGIVVPRQSKDNDAGSLFVVGARGTCSTSVA